MPVPNYWAIARYVYQLEDQRFCELDIHYVPDVNPVSFTQVNVTNLATQMGGAIGLKLTDVLTPDSHYVGVNLACHLNGVVKTSVSYAAAGVGTVASDELPPHDAMVIRKRTDVPGRTGYGRWFVGGVPEVYTEAGRLTAPGVGAYQALAIACFNPFTAAGTASSWQPCHYSRKDLTMIPLVGLEVTTLIKRQSKRRLRPIV